MCQGHSHKHGEFEHSHTHEGPHHHDHHTHEEIHLKHKILSANDEIAVQNRKWLEMLGVKSFNLMSSPGAGKTLLLEKTLEALKGKISCGVITGDLQTNNDAERLSNKGAPVHQIQTVSSCHLEAAHIAHCLPEVVSRDTKVLFIENVGNLVCPAAYDLGEGKKIVLLSITEGEDKPLKYPVMFSKADLVVLTKIDLAPHLDWDSKKAYAAIKSICPQTKVIEVSAKTGTGMDAWLGYLKA